MPPDPRKAPKKSSKRLTLQEFREAQGKKYTKNKKLRRFTPRRYLNQMQGRGKCVTPELKAHFLHAIAEGASLRIACKEVGISSARVVYKAFERDPVFRSDYDLARAERGDYYANEVVKLAEKVQTGKVAPDEARVAIGAYRWLASRMAPKLWGDRVAAEIEAGNGASISFNIVQAQPDKKDEDDA